MLEVGWSEILVIALILIIVVGPKDLPPMLRTFGRMATRLRGMANEFKGQFDEALREADLDDVRKGLSEVNKLNPTNTLRDAMNPIRKLSEDIKSDLKKASDISTPATPAAVDANPALDAPASDAVADANPVEPLIAPIAASVEPAAIAKIAEPAPLAQPFVPNVVETPVAKPKATRKKAVPPVTAAEPAAITEAVVKKPDNKPASKPATRKKPAVSEFAPEIAASEAVKPKRAAPRKKAEKAGDA